jgi:LPXTG-motif cell wall-anchored protein
MELLALFSAWLLQAAPESGADNTTIIRVVAGVLALVLVVTILVRRKRKASKEDWT